MELPPFWIRYPNHWNAIRCSVSVCIWLFACGKQIFNNCTLHTLLRLQYRMKTEKNINLIKEPPSLLFEFKSNLNFSHFEIQSKLNFELHTMLASLFIYASFIIIVLLLYLYWVLCIKYVRLCGKIRILWASNKVDVYPISLIIMQFSYFVINYGTTNEYVISITIIIYIIFVHFLCHQSMAVWFNSLCAF